MAEALLTVDQAARRLQIAPYTLREWLKHGRLRGIKLGRQWRVPERSLRELHTESLAPQIRHVPQTDDTERRWQTFFERLEVVHRLLDATGTAGVDGAQLIRQARKERMRSILDEG